MADGYIKMKSEETKGIKCTKSGNAFNSELEIF